MSLTFSVNIGTNKETTSYPLPDNLVYLTGLLKDNETKFISEESIRTVVLSLGSSFPFKVTSALSSPTASYLGFDSLNTDFRDLYTVTTGASSSWIKPKIYLGKRSYSGTYSYNLSHDIMGNHLINSTTQSLLTSSYSSDVDIFLFNTKGDSIDNRVTKLRILSGLNISRFPNSPYIQSQIVESGAVDTLSLDFVNLSGSVNVRSDIGTVSLNGIGLPDMTTLSASASNNKVLLWEDGYLNWGDITYVAQNYIGVTGSETEMFGNPLLINGYTLELNDSRYVPLTFNDVSGGTTFSNSPISEVLKRLVYPYLSPSCSIKILPPYDNGYVEVGTYPNPIVEYTINKKSLTTNSAVLTNMIPGNYPSISGFVHQSITTTSNGIVISPITATSTEFKIQVGDGSQTASATTNMSGIYPYFYGFSSLTYSMTNIELGNLTKSVESKSNKTIDLTGVGNYYFIYDFDYGTISNIYDNVGNIVSASFSHTSQVFSSPTGLWSGKKFYVYKWLSVPQIGPPSVNYEFEY